MNSIESRQELVEFLKEKSIFKVLDLRILEGISPIFMEMSCGPGHIVFKQGDAADAIYIIRTGSVEVIQGDPPKIIAYLTAGECFGEMALIHETPRTATIRVPEEAFIIKIPKAALKELKAKFPEVTSAVADVINHRLAGTLPFQAPGLQGNLAFFDLPTVIQTVVASRQAGVLRLFGRSGKVVAQLIMKDGYITKATFKHLSGENALLELMTRNDPLDFVFERQDVSSKQDDPDLRMKPPHMLLIEGARRADELPKLAQQLGWPSSTFLQSTNLPDWNKLGGEAATISPKLWLLMEVGCNIDEMFTKLPYDRYSLFLSLEEMLRRGFIKKESVSRAAHQALEKTMQLPKAAAMQQQIQPQSRLVPQPEPMKLSQSPSQVVNTVNAINAVTVNMATVLGKNEVRFFLNQALKKAAETHPHLGSLRVHPEVATLDLRNASPEFSKAESSVASLQQLMRIFIDIAARSQKIMD
jgi:hypothetical protein